MKKQGTPGIPVLAAAAVVRGVTVGALGVSHCPVGQCPFADYRFYILGLLPVVAGVGLFLRKRWGRMSFLLGAGLGLSYAVINILNPIFLGPRVPGSWTAPLIDLAFYVLLYSFPIWYLCRRPVMEQFT